MHPVGDGNDGREPDHGGNTHGGDVDADQTLQKIDQSQPHHGEVEDNQGDEVLIHERIYDVRERTLHHRSIVLGPDNCDHELRDTIRVHKPAYIAFGFRALDVHLPIPKNVPRFYLRYELTCRTLNNGGPILCRHPRVKDSHAKSITSPVDSQGLPSESTG